MKSTPVPLRIPDDMLAELEALRGRVSRPDGLSVTLAYMIRLAIGEGIKALRKKVKP